MERRVVRRSQWCVCKIPLALYAQNGKSDLAFLSFNFACINQFAIFKSPKLLYDIRKDMLRVDSTSASQISVVRMHVARKDAHLPSSVSGQA
jgi:hypothetical protein